MLRASLTSATARVTAAAAALALTAAAATLPEASAEAAVSGEAAAEAEGSPDWHQDGYGPGNTGWNPGETAITAKTIKDTLPRWKIPAATTAITCAPPQIAPVVADGRMVKLNPATGGVSAYNARTGKKLWNFEGIYYPRASALAVDDGVVVAASPACDPHSGDGEVVGIDAKTGKQLWRNICVWRTATITLDHGAVLVGGGGGGISDIGYGVNAYRVSDGANLWSTMFQVPAGAVAANGRTLLQARADDPFPGVPAPKWTMVDITTGKRVWHTGVATSGARAADPAGTMVFLADGPGLRAVSATTGKQLWRMNDGRVGEVGVDDRRIYVSLSNQVRAYDAKTGRFLWSRAMTSPGKPIRAADLLYVQTATAIAILNPGTGATVALSTPFRPVTGHVVVADGRLFVTDGSSVRAYTP